jgi:hypothetical protein
MREEYRDSSENSSDLLEEAERGELRVVCANRRAWLAYATRSFVMSAMVSLEVNWTKVLEYSIKASTEGEVAEEGEEVKSSSRDSDEPRDLADCEEGESVFVETNKFRLERCRADKGRDFPDRGGEISGGL